MIRVIAVVACGFSLAACSTSLPSLSFLKSTPMTETVRIESDPPGADAKTTQGQSCRTPCEVVVQGDEEFSVTLALGGYQPQTVLVVPGSATSQSFGFSATSPRFAPNPVYAELVPAPAEPPAKRKPPRKKIQRPVTAAAQPRAPTPGTTASVATAAEVMPDPAPAAEPAASATNYPWPSR
jgi:hypothetical protein